MGCVRNLPSANNSFPDITHIFKSEFKTQNNINTTILDKLKKSQRHKVRKRANFRNRYNQASHLTQDTNGKVTKSQLDITNESQEVSPFQASDQKASTKYDY